MRRSLLLLLLALGVCLSEVAEARKTNLPEERQVNWNEELKLSKEQKAQVAEIYSQSHEKIKSMMKHIYLLHH